MLLLAFFGNEIWPSIGCPRGYKIKMQRVWEMSIKFRILQNFVQFHWKLTNFKEFGCFWVTLGLDIPALVLKVVGPLSVLVALRSGEEMKLAFPILFSFHTNGILLDSSNWQGLHRTELSIRAREKELDEVLFQFQAQAALELETWLADSFSC